MSKLSTEERLQKEIVRISQRKERNIKAYQKSMFKKFVGYHIVTVFQVIVAIVLTLIAMFSLWNHFNPTQDYLYFIVIYAVFGNMLNMIYFGIAGEKLKRYKTMTGLKMKLREHQISEYFEYQTRDEYERAGYEWRPDWTEV